MTTIRPEHAYPLPDEGGLNLTVQINKLVRRVGPYEASRMLAGMIQEQWEITDEHDSMT